MITEEKATFLGTSSMSALAISQLRLANAFFDLRRGLFLVPGTLSNDQSINMNASLNLQSWPFSGLQRVTIIQIGIFLT